MPDAVTPFDGTVASMEEIVARCAERGDRNGYFAAMYLAVTETVRQRANAGVFDDGARMQRFVSAFAGRYLDAHRAWSAGEPCTATWQATFEASRRWRPVILQHLLLAMNAHINLDLGVVASTFGEAGGLDTVRADFDAINGVLGELIDGCEGALGEVSPWLGLADRIGGRNDETMIRFSLVIARRQAWSVAVRLAPLSGDERERAIAAVDHAAAGVAHVVEHPGAAASAVLLLVKARERAAPADVMQLLSAVRPAVA